MKIFPRQIDIAEGTGPLLLAPLSAMRLERPCPSLTPHPFVPPPSTSPHRPLLPGTETCSFKIKNASTDDRVLLFKIRRSEPKLLDFHPKFGIVEPGVTRHVSLQLASPKVRSPCRA